jgi:hypothetical protein
MKKLCTKLFPFLLSASFFIRCAGSNSQVIQSGIWGGQHIGMIVSDSSATLDYDCAHGTIDEPIITDDNGMFSVTGIYVFEKGGPIKLGEILDKHPAVYEGSIKGKEMTLIVKLTDTDVVIDTFSLTFKAEPIIYKCY